MAMMASNGAVDAAAAVVVGRDVRSVELDPKRSPAPRVELVVDWIWEAE
jgi:hypothetical protein